MRIHLFAAFLWLAACGGQRADETTTPRTEPEGPLAEDPVPEADTTCATLGRDACIDSTSCTLEQGGDGAYTCRAAEGACEENLAQSDQAACEAREICLWEAARCYCPEDVECICGGGPPPTCRVLNGA
jgi:hypothetical protein